MHGLKTKAIIKAKRAEKARRMAESQSQAAAPTPVDPEMLKLHVLLRMWEDMDGPHWLWRADMLARRHEHDMAEQAYDHMKKTRSARGGGYTTTHTRRPYVPWSQADSLFLRKLLGPKRPVVQDTVVTDTKRYVKSLAKTGGTRCDPKYEWKPLFFGGGGGSGPALYVSSIIKIMDMPTPGDLIAWLDDILPRLYSGELQARIQDIESRHGKPKSGDTNSVVQEFMREDARAHAIPAVAYERVRQAEYRVNLESDVGFEGLPKHKRG